MGSNRYHDGQHRRCAIFSSSKFSIWLLYEFESLIAIIFTGVSAVTMSIWALKKQKNYQLEFGKEFPRGRKAIIPFILWEIPNLVLWFFTTLLFENNDDNCNLPMELLRSVRTWKETFSLGEALLIFAEAALCSASSGSMIWISRLIGDHIFTDRLSFIYKVCLERLFNTMGD